MRKAAILVVLVGLVGWSSSVYATRATPPTRNQGDPDEFQAKQVFDGGALRLDAAARQDRACRKAGDKPQGIARVSARSAGAAGQAKISITLAGRTCLWER